VISAFDLASRDIGSPSDPYLYIRVDDQIKNERDNYLLDEPNPKFLKRFDFDASLPGTSMLFLDVYDYDDIFGDDLIGKTVIDLEDRYFNLNWLTLEDKPIEYRQIYHKSSTVS